MKLQNTGEKNACPQNSGCMVSAYKSSDFKANDPRSVFSSPVNSQDKKLCSTLIFLFLHPGG